MLSRLPRLEKICLVLIFTDFDSSINIFINHNFFFCLVKKAKKKKKKYCLRCCLYGPNRN